MMQYSSFVALTLIILTVATTVAKAQQMVGCNDEGACTGNQVITTKELCCNNRVEPFGAAYVMDGVEGCFRCPVVFGFAQDTLTAPERGEPFTVEFGFFSGVASSGFFLTFNLTLGTAGNNDVILLAPPLRFLADDPVFTNISFILSQDGIAQELDETFSITFEGLDVQNDLVFGADVTDVLNVTIVDADEVEVKLTEDDYVESEGAGAIVVQVEKDVRIANPLKLTVSPLTAELAASGGFVPPGAIPPDNPFSPNRADATDFDPTVLTITFEADELAPFPTSRITVPIKIEDDAVNEAPEQLFFAVLQVDDAVNFDTVNNDVRNFSFCIIGDNDPIAIGFEFQSYQFDEPAVLTPISGEVLLIKEDQRETEQTFAIQVTVDNPLSPVLPATLQSADPSVQFDYARSAPGLVSSTYLIPPEAFFISFNFSLNNDNVTEGFEAFLAVSQPSPTFGTSFESPMNAFAITQIGIVDDDSAVVGFVEQFITVIEGDLQAVLEVAILSGSLQRDLVLNLTLNDGSAFLGADYLLPDVSITLDSVTTSVLVNIPLINDMVFERTEMLTANLSFADDPDRNVTIELSTAEITILDDDVVELGFNPANYSVDEEAGFVNITVELLSGTSAEDKVVLVLTDGDMSMTDGIATAGVDYEPVTSQLLFPANTDAITFAIVIFPDNETEGNEVFNVTLMTENFILVDGEPVFLSEQELARIVVTIAVALVTIDDQNDVVIGDPFFTVPLYLPRTQLREMGVDNLALCYEVHGESNKWFNLVTDKCASVNGRFAYLSSSLNVIDVLGVKALDTNNRCVNVRVNVHGCTAEVNGVEIGMNERYSSGGVSVRRRKDRVRISVPNCNQLTLVMWAVCEIDLPNQPGEMIKLVVSRGLNFEKRVAHGLIGQFWNVPVSVQLQKRFNDHLNKWYTVNITTGTKRKNSRSFGGFLYNLNWERRPQTCLYVGDMQGDATYTTDTGGVIQGKYRDYEVSGPFSERGYKFGMFKKQAC